MSPRNKGTYHRGEAVDQTIGRLPKRGVSIFMKDPNGKSWSDTMHWPKREDRITLAQIDWMKGKRR